MLLDEHSDFEAAVQAVAAALCLPLEAVREAIEPCCEVVRC